MVTNNPPVKRNSFYMPALDGLRLLAFLLVFHRPLWSLNFEPIKALTERLFVFGWVGVDLFFCISAYLITELLIREHERVGRINVKFFYLRRMLRIWPLYFLILFLAFFIFPLAHISISPPWGSPALQTLHELYLPSFLAFFGNIAIAINGFPQSGQLSILWTLALEEQFYMIWPFFMALMLPRPMRTRYMILTGLILVPIYFRFVFYLWHAPWYFVYVNPLSRFDAFAFGALAAFLHRDFIKRGVSNIWIRGISLIIAVTTLAYLFSLKQFEQISNSAAMIWLYSLLAVGFAALLMYVINSKGVFVRTLSLQPIAWLGKISYGLYIYQIMGLFLAEFVMRHLPVPPGGWHWLVLMAMALGYTILLSSISYYFFERQFLKLKQRFTFIPSR